eukprot:scaffold10890_cov135-Isochrysis_galbana.AAC.1
MDELLWLSQRLLALLCSPRQRRDESERYVSRSCSSSYSALSLCAMASPTRMFRRILRKTLPAPAVLRRVLWTLRCAAAQGPALWGGGAKIEKGKTCG